MEQNEKIRLLLDVQEHPGNYTDEELERLLGDEEMAALLQRLATAKRAIAEASVPDVDAEWEQFEREHFTRRSGNRWLKVAAMFVGVFLLSAFTYAAIHAVRSHRLASNETTTEEVVIANQPDASQGAVEDALTDSASTQEQSVTFDNVPLETILDDIASRYGMLVEFRNQDVRSLRFYFVWQPDEDLDTALERLNLFESVNISKEGNTIVVE